MQQGRNQYLEQYRNSISEYIRDKATRRKRGVLVAVRSHGPSGFSVGWSLYNKNSEKAPFDRTVAFGLALMRANEPGPKEVPSSIKEHYNKMVSRAEKYFNNPDPEKNPKMFKIPAKVLPNGTVREARWIYHPQGVPSEN